MMTTPRAAYDDKVGIMTVVNDHLYGPSFAWHDDVIKWNHFPRYWPFVTGNGNGLRLLRKTPIQTGRWIDLTIVYSSVYSGAGHRKHQSPASLAFVQGIHRWPVNSPHKRPVTRKSFPFDDVIMVPISVDHLMTNRELWNPLSKAVPGKFHWSGEHNKRNCLQHPANFHRSRAWQIVQIVKTGDCWGPCTMLGYLYTQWGPSLCSTNIEYGYLKDYVYDDGILFSFATSREAPFL